MIFYSYRLLRPRPGRHGNDEKLQRFLAGVVKLKMGADGNRQAYPWGYIHHFFPFILLAPDLALALKEVPDLLNGLVPDRKRNAARRKGSMGKAAAIHCWQQAYLRAIEGRVIVIFRQAFRFKFHLSSHKRLVYPSIIQFDVKVLPFLTYAPLLFCAYDHSTAH